MKRNEQMIILVGVVLALLIGFWLVILSPKRNEASKLQDEVDQLQSSLSQAQQDVAAAESARKSFRTDYRRLVVLGKAVPADGDQSSLLVQLQDLADRAGVKFETFNLEAGAGTPPPPPPTTDSSSTDSSSTDSTSSDASATPTAAVASESAVSSLPIGASVGPAGLPIMPYTLDFEGGFSQIADFMESLDHMVRIQGGQVDAQGRLLTVDGFTLTASTTSLSRTPVLTAELNVTSFLTPADQGLTAGATPTGPSPTTPAPVSSTTTTSSATSTPTSTTP